MYIFQTNREFVEKKADKEFDGAQDFFTWIYFQENGITHGMEIFFDIFKDL
jgi:hypothetical protein